MEQLLDLFLNYLTVERGLSRNTLDAYGRDLARYLDFLETEGIAAPDAVGPAAVLRFLAALKADGLSPRSRARTLVALRMFHKFLLAEELCAVNPASRVEAPRSLQPLPHTLSPAEVERLLAAPAGETPLDLRDRAMLELLYATGLRVSELVGLRPGDVHLNISSPGWAKHAWSNVFAPWNAAAAALILGYERFSAEALLSAFGECGVTTFCAPPTVWRMLIQSDLAAADEVFLTGTAAEVTPVREIDGRAVGSGVPGPVTREIQAAYFAAVRGGDARYRGWLTPVRAVSAGVGNHRQLTESVSANVK